MNKTRVVTSIIFILIYLISLCTFFYFEKSYDQEGSIDNRCADKIFDGTDPTTGGQISHYENKNYACYFFHSYIAPFAYLIALSPFLFIVLMGCGMGGNCSQLQIYGWGAFAVLLNLIFYGAIGYALGVLLSKINNKFRKTE